MSLHRTRIPRDELHSGHEHVPTQRREKVGQLRQLVQRCVERSCGDDVVLFEEFGWGVRTRSSKCQLPSKAGVADPAEDDELRSVAHELVSEGTHQPERDEQQHG